MAVRHQGSVGFGLASAVCALVVSGCAAPAQDRPGALELRIEPEASYALVGRFQLHAIEPWSPSRDIDFGTATSQARVELPPGTFTLALGAGARLVCAGEDADPFASAAHRLVSAPPQIISITPGEITTAHIGFGAPPAHGAAPDSFAADPCSSALALTEPGAWR